MIDQIIATHKLEMAFSTLALATRPGLLASTRASQCSEISPNTEASLLECKITLVDAMFRMLFGLDANEPPKNVGHFATVLLCPF